MAARTGGWRRANSDLRFTSSSTPDDLPIICTIRPSSPWTGLIDWRKTAGLRSPCASPPLLSRLQLPPTVHSDSYYRLWQRRYVPFNVFTEKKRIEKINYMHNNPVKKRLESSPNQWPGSSFRFYYLNDSSVLTMDRLA